MTKGEYGKWCYGNLISAIKKIPIQNLKSGFSNICKYMIC